MVSEGLGRHSFPVSCGLEARGETGLVGAPGAGRITVEGPLLSASLGV